MTWLLHISLASAGVIAGHSRGKVSGSIELINSRGPGSSPTQEFSGVVVWLEPVGRARELREEHREDRHGAEGQGVQSACSRYPRRHGGGVSRISIRSSTMRFPATAARCSTWASTRPGRTRTVGFQARGCGAGILQYSFGNERGDCGAPNAVLSPFPTLRASTGSRMFRPATTASTSIMSAPCRRSWSRYRRP